MNDALPDLRQPLRLAPNRVWRTYRGGRLLDRIEGRPDPSDDHFPEDWVGSVTRAANPGREHLADEGLATALDAGNRSWRIDRLIDALPHEMLGHRHVEAFGPQPQLLVKLLDSAVRLHVQAHPTVAWAREHLGAASGKTEAWLILQVRDAADAWVWLGFQRPPTPETWRRILLEQDLAAMHACFDRVPVRPGDVLLVAGGVPHAIGPGLLMVEVQEPTDYVVRCEWSHGGLDLPESARTMGLGVDRVLGLFDFAAVPASAVRERYGPRPQVLCESAAGRETSLLARPQTDRLELRRIESTGDAPLALEHDGRFSILVVLDGRGQLTAGGATVELEPWSRVLLPAAAEDATLGGRLALARCLPPLPEAS